MTLSVVATPIGNLGDISSRARAVLVEATLILAEDTRTTRKLFLLLEIDTAGKTFLSSHAQSTQKEIAHALEECSKHEHIALVSDAGTPAISDPGSFFIHQFRTRYPEALVLPVPGASAVLSALAVSGFPSSHFEFFGFIPHKKGRETLFKKIAATAHTVVLYESPHRILKTLESLAAILGDRPVMIGREMTKQFEEYPLGTAATLLAYYDSHADKVRGEFVIVIAPMKSDRDILEA